MPNDPKHQPEVRNEPTQFSGDQIATPPEGPPFIDTIWVDVTVGPMKGAVLHLPNADATQAIDDKWAVLREEVPHDINAPVPPPLTDTEYAAALAAADAYYQTISDPASKSERAPKREPAPKHDEDDDARKSRQREMTPGAAGTYPTRGVRK